MSIEVLISESMMNATKDVVYKVIGELSIKYGFDKDEALRNIGLNVKSSSSKPKSKEVKEVKLKAKFALPYSGEMDISCCQGLRQNQGLYTQCSVSRCDSGAFCKSCQTSADKNDGVPEYGTIESRLKAYTEGMEYKDPSGKSPTPYAKVMKKLKVSREEVEEEAGKLNMVINPIHFETEAVKKSGRPALKKKPEGGEVKPKGRPKKAKKVLELAGEEEDLFASLVMSANKNDSEDEAEQDEAEQDEPEEDVDTVVMSESEGEEESKLAAKLAAEEESKLAAKLAGEAKKLTAEAKKETERLEKEEKKKAVEAKKEAERLEKEEKKKAAEAKKEAERLEKEAKKKATEEKKAKKEVKKSASTEVNVTASDAVEEDAEEEFKVRKFEFEGKKYLRSKKSGIIYNMEQDKIGTWNEAKQRIDFDTIEEESCDEYEA
jgi:chemotaxis protein histidine kinase CheA